MKTAKGVLIGLLAAVLCIGFSGTGIAAGGQGNGQGSANGGGVGISAGSGSGICSSLLAAQEDAIIEGTVYSVGYFGQGIAVDTGEEIVQIYGIGPLAYWEEVLGETKPVVGDVIRVTGKMCVFSDGAEKFIVFTLTFGAFDSDGIFVPDGATFILRDETTGLPLWRGGGFGYSLREQTRECPYLEDSSAEL